MQDNTKESSVKETAPKKPSAEETSSKQASAENQDQEKAADKKPSSPGEPDAEKKSPDKPSSEKPAPKKPDAENPEQEKAADKKPSTIDLLVKRLNQLPHLSGFSDQELRERFLPMSKVRVFKRGDIIIKEGTLDSWIYFIISGQVKIMKHGKTISVLKRCGEVFGEMSVIDDSERSYTVLALTDTTCLAMDSSLLDKMDEQARDSFLVILYRIFAEILTERLRLANSELMRLREENARLKKSMGAAAGS